MKIHQVKIKYDHFPEAARTPLDREMYGPFRTKITELPADKQKLMFDYNKRTGSNCWGYMGKYVEVVTREIPDTYVKEAGSPISFPMTPEVLDYVYNHAWPSIDKCIKQNAFAVIDY